MFPMLFFIPYIPTLQELRVIHFNTTILYTYIVHLVNRYYYSNWHCVNGSLLQDDIMWIVSQYSYNYYNGPFFWKGYTSRTHTRIVRVLKADEKIKYFNSPRRAIVTTFITCSVCVWKTVKWQIITSIITYACVCMNSNVGLIFREMRRHSGKRLSR